MYTRDLALKHKAELMVIEERLRRIHGEIVQEVETPDAGPESAMRLLNRASTHLAETIINVDTVATEVSKRVI